MGIYGRLAHETLNKYSLAPKKRLGQNFLVHQQTAEAIVKAGNVASNATIIEVGPGLGALTIPLAKAAKAVIAFEIDSGIVRFHETEGDLPENVTIVHQDFLKADIAAIRKQCGSPLQILANLPYSISNPFIFKLIENAEHISTVTVMLQKEVAERLSALPGSKDYGVPTILLGSVAAVQQKLLLKPSEFYPQPKVHSMVITIDFTRTAPGIEPKENYNWSLMQKLVRTAFNQRRKTLANTLSHPGIWGQAGRIHKELCREKALAALSAADILPKERPENLTINDFSRLSVEVAQLMS